MRAKSPTDVRLELCPRNLRNTSNLVGSLILLSVSHAPIDAMYFLDGRAKIKFSFVSQVRWSIFRFECRTDGAYILLRTPRSECHMRIEMAAQLEILTLCGLLTLYTSTKRILASSCFLTNAFPYSFSLTIFFPEEGVGIGISNSAWAVLQPLNGFLCECPRLSRTWERRRKRWQQRLNGGQSSTLPLSYIAVCRSCTVAD